eukprot:CAMPEP_0117468088 /NCGR_PEP_ID=MMETSP0784-20121206/5994_1 /TAXON_ID=39447 /ORGANISM="" /LENGTH=359 /DNA_ID=CAMNT_0005262083 /DNA_START=37 /DNA_END=1112 /DNA_ORIENTATION=+
MSSLAPETVAIGHLKLLEEIIKAAASQTFGSDVSPLPSSTGAAPSGINFEERENLGRVLVAARDFCEGELLFVDEPLLVIPNCALGTRSQFGPIMRELSQRCRSQVNLDMDTICEYFVACHATLPVLDAFESHDNSPDYIAGQLASEVAAAAVRLGVLPKAALEQDLARFIRVLAVNVHIVKRVKGVALFHWLSMFTHSCSPNADYSKEQDARAGGFVATPRALRHIAAGEVIEMSYLSLQNVIASTPVRQELLRVQKNFVCGCKRCLGIDTLRLFACQNCPMGFSVPTTAGISPAAWRCCQCGVETMASALPLVEEDRLLRFICEFEPPDEQSVHSMLAVVQVDLGGGRDRPPQHFLR